MMFIELWAQRTWPTGWAPASADAAQWNTAALLCSHTVCNCRPAPKAESTTEILGHTRLTIFTIWPFEKGCYPLR